MQSGERVAVETRVVEVIDNRQLELEASLNAADSLKVKVGQSALLTLDGTGQTFSATVARINPVAAAGSRAVLAPPKAEFIFCSYDDRPIQDKWLSI